MIACGVDEPEDSYPPPPLLYMPLMLEKLLSRIVIVLDPLPVNP